MTVGTTASRIVCLGDGVAPAFSVPFLIEDAADVVATYTDTNGNQTVLAHTDYTIVGFGNPLGCVITYPVGGAPLALGTSLTVQRVVPYVQTTSLSDQGPTFAAIEGMGDSLEFQIQQLADGIVRSLQWNVADPATHMTLPPVAQLALQMLGFDSFGNPVAAQPASALVSTAMAPVVAAATIALGRIAMGVPGSADLASTTSAALGTNLVGYDQAISGFVGRLLRLKLLENVSFVDFGADPTGVVDATASIQAGIDHLASIGGGTLYANAGTYLVNGTIYISTSGIEIKGVAGKGSRLNFDNGTNDGIVVGFQGAQLSGIKLTDLELYGVSKTDGFMVNIANIANSVFSGLQIRDAYSGIHLDQISDVRVDTTDIVLNAAGTEPKGLLWTSMTDGAHTSDVLTLRDVAIDAGSLANSFGILIDGACAWLRIDNCGVQLAHYGFVVRMTVPSATYYPIYFRVVDLEVLNSLTSGVTITCGRSMRFAQCTFDNAGVGNEVLIITADAAASVTGGLTFENCAVRGGLQTGVLCTARQVDFITCVVHNNSLSGSGVYPAIHLVNDLAGSAAIDVRVIGCSFNGEIDWQSFGVVADANVQRVTIMGCDFSGCTLGAISDSSGAPGYVTYLGNFASGGPPLADRIAVVPADPPTLYDGDMWVDDSSGQLKVRLAGVTRVVNVT